MIGSFQIVGKYKDNEFQAKEEDNGHWNIYKNNIFITGPFAEQPALDFILSKGEVVLVAHVNNEKAHLLSA